VFGTATALGVFSFLQAARLTSVNSKPGMPIDAGKLLLLNLALWYLPALMMPGVVAVARHFPLDAGRRGLAIAARRRRLLRFALRAFTSRLDGRRFLLWT
jgi:hypothetical protein